MSMKPNPNHWMWDIIIPGSGAVTAAVVLVISLGNTNLDTATRITIAAASAALPATFGFCYRTWLWANSTNTTLGNLNQHFEDLKDRFDSLSDHFNDLFDARQMVGTHEILREIRIRMLLSQSEAMHTTNKGFTIHSTDWAMQSNIIFWQIVTGYVRKHDMGLNRPWKECFAIHANKPNIWKSDSAVISLQAQQSYIRAGGMIHRIITGEHPIEHILQGIERSIMRYPNIIDALGDRENESANKDELADYGDVIRLMKFHGIDIAYAYARKGSKEDAAVIQLTDVKYIQIGWQYSLEGEDIVACTFEEQDLATYLEKWEGLKFRAEGFSDEVLGGKAHLNPSTAQPKQEVKPYWPRMACPAVDEPPTGDAI
jgi:hypothetical protein